MKDVTHDGQASGHAKVKEMVGFVPSAPLNG